MSEEKKKKQLIQVKGLPGGSSPGYSMSSINFAFVSAPTPERVQLTELMTCREYVLKKIWHAANNYNQKNESPPFDLLNMRLLIVHDPSDITKFKQRLFSGKAALNVLEKINNWESSTITTVKHSYYKNAWLLTGPSEWMSQPQLLSLSTWILRLSMMEGPLDTDNYDTLESNLYSILQKDKRGSDNYLYLRNFWDKMYVLMKYHREIFEDGDLHKAWPGEDFGKNVHINGGIQTLVENNISYSKYATEIQKRFRGLCKKHLPRQNRLIEGRK